MQASNLVDMKPTTNPAATAYIDLATAAERTGINYRTLRNYHHRAERHRRLAEQEKDLSYIRPGDLPAPATRYGRSPVWEPAAIDAWLANRPGQGKGGGRPVGWSPNPDHEKTKKRRNDG